MVCNSHALDDLTSIFIKCHRIQGLVTCAACGIFGALTWGMTSVHSFYPQWHIKLRAKGTAVALEVIGGHLQSMVNVNRVHLSRPLFGAR